MDDINHFKCICAPGYTGSNCQWHINPCDSNPCMTGATCVNNEGDFHCICPYGSTGPRCEVSTFALSLYCGVEQYCYVFYVGFCVLNIQ